MKLVLIESTTKGINSIREFNVNSMKDFNNSMKSFLIDDFGEDYFVESKSICFETMKEFQIFEFISDFINNSIVDKDHSGYKIYEKETFKEFVLNSKSFVNMPMDLHFITIETRQPKKWLFVDIETEEIYKYINNNFIKINDNEVNQLKRICIEKTEN